MWRSRVLIAIASFALLAAATPGVVSAGPSDHAQIKVKGFADVPGAALILPLPDGSAPVTIEITFGTPGVTIPVQITTATKVKLKGGLPISLADGDAVKVDMVVDGPVLRATKLSLESFPELELVGVASGLPAGGLALPLAPGATFDFILTLDTSGVEVPVRLASTTKIHHHTGPIIENGDRLRVEAVVRGGVIVATKLKGPDDDDDDDD